MALHYQIIPVTPFQQNCTLLWCDETREAAVVDPGGDLALIRAAIDKAGVKVTQILLTHAHLDHAGGTAPLARELDAQIVGPQQEDAFWIEAMPAQSQMFGMPEVEQFTPDRWLNEGDQVKVGNQNLKVLHCPGHTPGHVVFFCAEAALALVGDVLFQGSIGRSDFPRGDQATLLRSIKEKLFPLGDEIRFIPGHGPMSSFGVERQTNPFLTFPAY